MLSHFRRLPKEGLDLEKEHLTAFKAILAELRAAVKTVAESCS